MLGLFNVKKHIPPQECSFRSAGRLPLQEPLPKLYADLAERLCSQALCLGYLAAPTTRPAHYQTTSATSLRLSDADVAVKPDRSKLPSDA